MGHEKTREDMVDDRPLRKKLPINHTYAQMDSLALFLGLLIALSHTGNQIRLLKTQDDVSSF